MYLVPNVPASDCTYWVSKSTRSVFIHFAFRVHVYVKGTTNVAACTNMQHSSSDHNTRVACCFIKCLNEELIITANLALYESSRTHCVLDKQMNHRPLDLGTGTIKSTSAHT